MLLDNLAKMASVVPILKKPTLDRNVLSNYRPVSNLPYIGKIAEKVVVAQLTDHIKTNNLDQPLQSAYKKHNSTETAIVKIMNDMLLSLDDDKCILLVMLDLSSVFDTVNHTLLDRNPDSITSLLKELHWLPLVKLTKSRFFKDHCLEMHQ